MGEWCVLQRNYHVKRSLSYILEDCVYVKVVFGLIFQRHFTQSMVAPDWLKHWYIHTWLVTVHCIFLPGTPYTPANQTYHLKSSIYWQHQGAPTVTLGLRKSHCFLYIWFSPHLTTVLPPVFIARTKEVLWVNALLSVKDWNSEWFSFWYRRLTLKPAGTMIGIFQPRSPGPWLPASRQMF